MKYTSQMHEGRHRLSAAHLLTALAILFVVMPLVDQLAYGQIIETAAFTLVLLAGVNAIGGHRRIQITAALLAAPALIMHWLHHFYQSCFQSNCDCSRILRSWPT